MTRVNRTHPPALGPAAPFRFPAVSKHRLPNGLAVWTVEHRAVPVLALVLVVKAGASADPPDLPGLASLTGAMLEEGAGDLPALDLQRALAGIGAAFETEVNADATVLRLTTVAEMRDRALELLAAMAVRPRLERTEVDRVRRLRLNRLLQLRQVPQAVADRTFLERLYPGHPYGHLAIGTEEGLERLVPEDVWSFHATRFRPSGAALIAVGDLDADEIVATASRTFGDWSASPQSAGSEGWSPPQSATGLVAVDRPGAPQSELRIGLVAAPRSSPDYHALVVLNAILGGLFVSRLNLKLREQKGVTYGARSWFEFRREPGPFWMAASVDRTATAEAISDAVAELEAIGGTRPPADEELQLAKSSLTRGYPRGFESAEQIARAIAQGAVYDLPDDEFERFVPGVEAVTAEQVARVAAQYLRVERLLTVVVGDRSVIRGTENGEHTTEKREASAPDMLGAGRLRPTPTRIA